MRKFLTQITEMVDWTQDHSFAYLEGQHFDERFQNEETNWKETDGKYRRRKSRQSAALSRWNRAAASAAKEKNIDFTIEYTELGDFKGIVFHH